MNTFVVNKILKALEKGKNYKLLAEISWFMYKVKGKNIKSVEYLNELNIWQFEIGNEFYFSTGSGWIYDYDYLLHEFSTHLGYNYLPQNGDCVIDVGAGIGEELMIFTKRVGASGKVFAVEAHPATFKALTLNCKMNKLTNAILLNVAISDTEGEIFIENTTNSLANTVSKERILNSTTVRATTIDQIVNEYKLSQVDFLKVNIEGAEQLLIKGIGKSIHKIRNMAISCHDFRYYQEKIEFFKTKKIVLEFLKDSDFNVSTRNTGNPLLDDYVYASSRKN